MKQAKDFLEKLTSDEAFAKEIGEKAQAKIDAGETDYIALWSSIAAEYDYEITEEELHEWHKNISLEVSDEELGKIAGGTSPLIAVTSVLVTGVSGLLSLSYSLNSTEKPNNPHNEGEPYGPF